MAIQIGIFVGDVEWMKKLLLTNKVVWYFSSFEGIHACTGPVLKFGEQGKVLVLAQKLGTSWVGRIYYNWEFFVIQTFRLYNVNTMENIKVWTI